MTGGILQGIQGEQRANLQPLTSASHQGKAVNMMAEPRKGSAPVRPGVNSVQSRSQHLLQACTAPIPQAYSSRRTGPPVSQPIMQKPVSKIAVPAAPVTAAKKLPVHSKSKPLTTPLTDPDSLSGTSDLLSESSTSSSLLSSNHDASSYQPSSSDDGSTDAKVPLPVGKPPLPSKTAFNRHAAGAKKQQTSLRPATDNAAVPSNTTAHVPSVLRVS